MSIICRVIKSYPKKENGLRNVQTDAVREITDDIVRSIGKLWLESKVPLKKGTEITLPDDIEMEKVVMVDMEGNEVKDDQGNLIYLRQIKK